MALLAGFALLAGAGTALSPCVLPILPALLSAGASGGRRRPLGVVAGLALTFTIAVVALASVVDGVGRAGVAVRTLAILVLAVFGLLLLAPPLAARLEAWLSPLARLGPTGVGEGFWSGLGVGAALGFVFAPCAGPILAAVVSVAATQGANARLVVVALAYATGAAAVLLLFALGGRRVADRIRAAGRGATLQRATGAVMVLTAVAMAGMLDVKLESALANHLPAFVVNPANPVETSRAVERRLADLRGPSRFDGHGSSLKDLGPAPDFTGNQRWFNTPGGRPLTLAGLRGRVVLVDFWTYTCINCLRTLPELKALDARYRNDGLTIVGVHTPEFSFEADAGNVRRAIADEGIGYPVAQDNAYKTWEAYGNQYWPAQYLIDARGHVRYTHFGEGDEEQTEAAIRSLLAEAGRARLGPRARANGEAPPSDLATPETYVGTTRAQGWYPDGGLPGGARDFGPPPATLPLNVFALSGIWRLDPESGTAGRGAGISATFAAKKVYLVLSSAGNRLRDVLVRVDGKPYRRVTVKRQRLYELVSLRRARQHRLDLTLEPGLSAYAFTFG
jgi:cytochrome c biogenesis protein CcdA/thiol-disulfide isomerase/thioredoxin